MCCEAVTAHETLVRVHVISVCVWLRDLSQLANSHFSRFTNLQICNGWGGLALGLAPMSSFFDLFPGATVYDQCAFQHSCAFLMAKILTTQLICFQFFFLFEFNFWYYRYKIFYSDIQWYFNNINGYQCKIIYIDNIYHFNTFYF